MNPAPLLGPLAGLRILAARAGDRGGALARLLTDSGATAHAVSVLDILPPEDFTALEAAARDLNGGAYEWVAFTSVNAVAALLDRAATLELDPLVAPGTRVAAVGPATGAALREAGIPVDLLPERGSGAGLAAEWPAAPSPRSRVLLPQSSIALPHLADSLSANGYQVDRVLAYRTVPAPLDEYLRRQLADGAFDVVLLTSPSAVAALSADLGPGTVIGAIGDTTATAVTDHGLTVAFTADAPTDAALMLALLRWAYLHDRKGLRP